MSRADPVGFFDSGQGGRCILEAFRRRCPNEFTVYLADTANCPYGNRSAEEVARLSEACASRLLAEGCKMVVVACNTATAAAIDRLRARHPEVPFIGLEPAVKPAALRSRTGVVAVLATMGTFSGRIYRDTSMRFAKGVTVLMVVADEFVEEVERLGDRPVEILEGAELARVEGLVRRKVEPLLAAGADHLVLGCTHFPRLKAIIERLAAGRATVLDPSDAVARQAERVLMRLGLRNPSAERAAETRFLQNPGRLPFVRQNDIIP